MTKSNKKKTKVDLEQTPKEPKLDKAFTTVRVDHTDLRGHPLCSVVAETFTRKYPFAKTKQFCLTPEQALELANQLISFVGRTFRDH